MSLVGQPIRRVEDRRFLTGQGRYVGDITLARQCHGVVILSPHAHADIVAIDAAAARAMPGVLCVLTGADAAADGLGGLPAYTTPEDWGGSASFKTAWPVLAHDRARCVGDRVAFVVADTLERARDAAEAVAVEYRVRDAVLSPVEASRPDAPRVWEGCERNLCFEISHGDRDATEACFGRAAHVVEVTVDNRRLSANPIEPRCAIGEFEPGTGRYTLHTSSQNPHGARKMIAESVFGIPESRLRVISPDVGGGFGMKANPYPEDALVLWAARRCGRPVKWVSTRSEALMGDNHGRDQVATGEMALDAEGHILAIRADAAHALGAYFVSAAASPVRTALRLVPSVYHVPTVWLTSRAVFTNTSPMGVYRGAGRPEANLLVERLLDLAASRIGIGQDEIRARNMIPASAMPYTTATGFRYDTGDFPALLAASTQALDWPGFAARRDASRAAGRLRGRAVCGYIEYAGVLNERMELRLDANCEATILAGTHSHGQGHATAFAQIVADRLGIPIEGVHYVQGDTAEVSFGRGTYAARSSLVGGVALSLAADRLLDRARPMAAKLAGVAESEVSFFEGGFQVVGGNRFIPLGDVARACYGPYLPPGIELGLEATASYGAMPPSYPNGCHACEIEIDPETGEVSIDRYVTLDDVGAIINPMICEGQIQGGLAQGFGQALLEEVVYDRDGQLLTGSFMDYAMPRASDFPAPRIQFRNVPSTTNPLGVKAVGESSIICSPAAIANAILDALRPLGVTDIQLPATPNRVRAAIAAV